MNMINEDKAREIAKDFKAESTAYNAASQMAEWKDKQIDTIMLTTQVCLKSYFLNQGNSEETIDGFISAIKSQIDKNLENL